MSLEPRAAEVGTNGRFHALVYYRRGPFLDKFSGRNYDVGGERRELALGEAGEDVPPADLNEHREWESDFDIFRADAGSGPRTKMVSVAQPRTEVRARPVNTLEIVSFRDGRGHD